MKARFVGSVSVCCALVASALLVVGCSVEGRIEGFPTENPLGQVASVEVTPDSASVAVGGNVDFGATAHTDGGTPVSGVSFIWEIVAGSGNASVDNTGLVTGKRPGQAIVRAAAGGVASDSAVVTVEATQ